MGFSNVSTKIFLPWLADDRNECESNQSSPRHHPASAPCITGVPPKSGDNETPRYLFHWSRAELSGLRVCQRGEQLIIHTFVKQKVNQGSMSCHRDSAEPFYFKFLLLNSDGRVFLNLWLSVLQKPCNKWKPTNALIKFKLKSLKIEQSYINVCIYLPRLSSLNYCRLLDWE